MSASLQEQIAAIQDALRVSKNEADAARRDAESAKTAAIAELSQSHRNEISEIRAKLDERTEDLMQARQEISDLKMALHTEQTKVADLERQVQGKLL